MSGYLTFFNLIGKNLSLQQTLGGKQSFQYLAFLKFISKNLPFQRVFWLIWYDDINVACKMFLYKYFLYVTKNFIDMIEIWI